MKRRIFAIALAGALALSLAACGGGGGTSSSNPGGSSSASSSQTDGSSSADASNPDGSQPDASDPYDGDISFTLNRTDITLNKAGATFQLRYTVEPSFETTPQFSSSDESVAKVDDQGKITAVAPGTAVITAEHPSVTDAATGKYISATCTVTCDWKVETTKPVEPSKPSGGSSSSGTPELAPPDTATSVDLQKFYTDMETKYEFTFMMEADKDTLAEYQSNMAETAPKAYYAGLDDLKLKQRVIYMCGMMPAPTGDIALVEVENAKDVATVKAIFQAQIDYMVGDGEDRGGAFYPMEQETWGSYARIVTNGNYVMLIANENCDDIVNAFNALFK